MNFVLEGRSCVFLEQWDGAVAARAVDRYKLGSSAGTPLHITDLLDAADRENLDVSSLSDYMAGATTVPGLLVQRCEQAGMRTYRGYGSSEHPVSISGKALDPLEKRLTTEGRPVQGTDVRLLGEDGVDVADGEPGEIAVRGPQQFLGYRDTRLNEKAFTSDGWFLTGDIARRDPDGFYRITDRKKDIIIRAGENISSREVEDHVLAHPAVYEVAAVAEPHARTGERVCVFVVLQPGQGLTVPDLVAWFAARGVARQKTPERIECVDNLPRNAAGKVLKHELRTRLNG
jgi:acyl-CoA synthetase (AMP-forming)/AMP-acid ligase II